MIECKGDKIMKLDHAEYCVLLECLFDNIKFREALETVCQKKYKDFSYQSEFTRKLAPLFQEYFSLDELKELNHLNDIGSEDHELSARVIDYHKELLSRSVYMMIKNHEYDLVREKH